MQVNFYDYATTVNQVKEFGLVDPDDKEGKKPAFVSYDKTTDKWNAKVECNNRTDYSFIAVDNNVPLTVKNNGKDETASSCDAMLYTPKTVCFIELKADKKGNDWLNHGSVTRSVMPLKSFMARPKLMRPIASMSMVRR